MSYVVIDNFLEKKIFNDFKEVCFSSKINWFFKPHMTIKDEYFFSHTFYQKNETTSPFFNDYILPVLNLLNVKAVIEIRANMMLKKNYVYESDFHTDNDFKCKTAIFYLNDCNGYTVLKDADNNIININCKENRILVFDSNMIHKAISQTDFERRIVINFNYFDDKTYE